MNIFPAIFEAYLKCPTKCYLRAHGEAETGNLYAEWLRNQNESYRNDAIRCLRAGMGQQEFAVRPPVTENLKSAKWQIAVELVVQAQNVESIIDAVERIPSEKSGKAAQFLPIRYIFRNKLTKDDKLLLAFDAFVLSEQLGRKVELGKIIHGDNHSTLKVKTASMSNRVGNLTERIVALLSTDKPPDLVLNRHCGECEFQSRCRQKAVEKDDLSLLSGMSEKEREKFNSKGIFTVTQLSYTFRPRRRPKRACCKRKCEHSLRALALRNQTIYIAKRPTMSSSPCQLYVDVEGIPDRDFYYLQLREGLRKGRLIHVDETQVVTRSSVGYVWVFADMHRVFYAYSDTREGDVLHETLEGFEGVLVSDFYAVYDSVKCAQQKCHIHLIRDMNDDLFRNPFDEELKELAREYTMLFSPIIETIDRYGLAAYHLWKHRDRVDKFLGRILSREYVSDNAKNYQRRFRKYGGVLFTFLQHDSVPWNNNNAEHVIKRIAKTRNRMKGLTTSRGIREYLVLLSICETLTIRNVAPLKFFVSGCRDIDAYLAKKQPCGPAMEDSLSPADSNRHDAQ